MTVVALTECRRGEREVVVEHLSEGDEQVAHSTVVLAHVVVDQETDHPGVGKRSSILGDTRLSQTWSRSCRRNRKAKERLELEKMQEP